MVLLIHTKMSLLNLTSLFRCRCEKLVSGFRVQQLASSWNNLRRWPQLFASTPRQRKADCRSSLYGIASYSFLCEDNSSFGIERTTGRHHQSQQWRWMVPFLRLRSMVWFSARVFYRSKVGHSLLSIGWKFKSQTQEEIIGYSKINQRNLS